MKRGLFLFFFALALCHCTPTNDSPHSGIFILIDGYFLEVDNLDAYAGLFPLPWPRQVRVADMYCRDSVLYLLVNRRGIAALNIESGGSARFTYSYDPPLFSDQTAELLFPFKEALICHLYIDDFLADKKITPPEYRARSFLKFTPAENGLAFNGIVTPARQKQDPRWQPVVVNRLDEETLAIEWKQVGEKQVSFVYSSFNIASEKEEERRRSWFLAAYRLIDIREDKIDASYARLFKSVLAALQTGNDECLVSFTLTDLSDKRVERYFYKTASYEQSDAGRHFSVPVIRQGKVTAALPPGEKVFLITDQSREVQTLSLPTLPLHFRYTGMAFLDGYICVSFEDIRFTRVGAAGLVVKALP